MHYPSWFQRNDNYNTMAVYGHNPDGTVSVHNSSIVQGKQFDSYGYAAKLGNNTFHVEFPPPEVTKLQASQQFTYNQPKSLLLNYVVDKLWLNDKGDYIFAVVTDQNRGALYVLSRFKHPSRLAYDEIMAYVVANYDRDRLVQTPQFD
jgi:lipocalin